MTNEQVQRQNIQNQLKQKKRTKIIKQQDISIGPRPHCDKRSDDEVKCRKREREQETHKKHNGNSNEKKKVQLNDTIVVLLHTNATAGPFALHAILLFSFFFLSSRWCSTCEFGAIFQCNHLAVDFRLSFADSGALQLFFLLFLLLDIPDLSLTFFVIKFNNFIFRFDFHFIYSDSNSICKRAKVKIGRERESSNERRETRIANC